MAINEKVKPFDDEEFRKGNISGPKEGAKPFENPSFRIPSLDAGTVLDRRKFEANLRRFWPLTHVELDEEQVAQVASQVTIVQNIEEGGECYWEKVGDDVWYKPGDVYCVYGIYALHGVLSDPSASAYLKLTNPTDTEYDTYIQHSTGAVEVKRWTHGLDDSLDNDWLLCAGDILTDTVTEETYELDIAYDTFLLIGDGDNARIQKWLSADGTYLAKIGTAGSGDAEFNVPIGICSDGTYVYVTDNQNDRIKKHLLSDLSFVAAIGSHGSGNDNFNLTSGICTDGTWLYIIDRNNNRVVKRLCSDLSYVSETSGPGFNFGGSGAYICTDGTHLYTVQTPGATYRIYKHYCDDLALDIRVMPVGTDGHIDSATITGVCTTGGFLYMLNNNSFGGSAAVYKYACTDLTWVSQFGTNESTEGHTALMDPGGIATNGTYLFISDSNGVAYARILKWGLDGTFVAHYGAYGSEASESGLDLPRGVALSGQITRRTIIPRRGPILRAKADATACEAYVSFQFRNECRFRENSVANANYVGIRAPVSVTSYDLVLPGATSSGSQALTNNGSGTLSWVTYLTSVTAHNVLSATHGDTVTASVVKGDLIYGNATPKWARLAPNSTATKNFLTETSSVPAWGTIAQADITGLTTADGPTFDHLHLTTDLAVAEGGTGVSTLADGGLVIGNAAGAVEVVAAGTTTQILVGGGALTAPVWGTDIPTAVTIGTKYIYRAEGTDVPVADGGTGKSSFTQYAIPYASAATTISEIAIGAAGKVLAVNATTDGYEWIAAGGALALDDLTDVDAAGPDDHDIIQYHTGVGWVHGALPAGGAHDFLSATHGDTTAGAVVAGGIIYGDNTPKWTQLAHGSDGDVLTLAAGLPSWAAPAGGGAHALLSATHNDTTADAVERGDVLIGSGATPKWTRLPKGTATYVLTMGADEPAWAEATGGGAPAGAKYITQEADAGLSAEQSLGALATGIVKNTTTASVGVLSIATGADIPARPLSVTTITATGATNWSKVAGATWCLVKLWGGGGSGARAANGSAGGGGGGGGYIEKIFNYADLSDPVSVTVAAGGAAQTSDDVVGNVGGNTTFGAYLTAYGGGGGSHATTLFGGGGGGGTSSVGVVGSGTAGGAGGGPAGGFYTATTGATRHSGFGGGSGGVAGPIAAGDSGWGGGGGGGGTATTGNGPGGNSLFGGGGGGGGSDTGTPSAGGSSVFGGAGGAGAKDAAAATAGTQPGGGGGGSEAANSGKGGDGQAIIISF